LLQLADPLLRGRGAPMTEVDPVRARGSSAHVAATMEVEPVQERGSSRHTARPSSARRARPQPTRGSARAWAWLLLACLSGCGRSELVGFDGPARDAGRPDAGGCAPGFALIGGACVEIAASLDGLRWELPCLTPDPSYPEHICFTGPDVTRSTSMSGAPGRLYDVQVRVRGVVETRRYVGGSAVAPLVRRGAEASPSAADAWNVYRLAVSDPPERWYLNAGASGEYVCHGVDATFTVRVRAQATVTLFASSVDDRRSQIRNRDDAGTPLVAPGVPPAPRPFDGQFLQLDVLGVTPVP